MSQQRKSEREREREHDFGNSQNDDATFTPPIDSGVSTPYFEFFPSTPTELSLPSKLCKFNYYELKKATRSFRPDGLLGEGGFGHVYKGWIDTDSGKEVVAIKILNLNACQGHKEWLAEVNYLGELEHPNLVKLIGYCHEDELRVLVYEFLPNRSLETHLFGTLNSLSWDLRLKIALGSAKGLAFLHEGVKKPIIYRDFKTSNILLDTDFNAKLSDFGHARDGPEGDETHVSTRVVGTFGYSAPKYMMTGHLTTQSDVYSYGVVLLELITGRKSFDKNRKQGEKNLVEWARRYMVDKQSFHKLVDPRLEGEELPTKSLGKIIEVAAWCLDRKLKARPKMSEVVEVLENLPNLTETLSTLNPSLSSKTSHPNDKLNDTEHLDLASEQQQPKD